jgi:probable F420-dependent oxidoreductase
MKIGFNIPLANYEGGSAPGYSAIKNMAQQAESSGFDSIWLYDHLLYRFEGQPTLGIWECWTMLTALAEATERVELGTLVACNSFRNPALIAKMAETLDEISDGRLILGLGAGWNKPEYDAFGIPFDNIRDRFEEAVQIIRPLLRERQTSFQGAHYQVEDCEITPAGPRENGVPLMIGAFGPRMMKLAARYGDSWNTAYTGSAASFEAPLARFRDACVAVGRDPDDIEVTALANIAFTDLAAPPPPRPGVDGKVTPVECMVGTPDEMAMELKKYEDMGTSHIMFHCYPYNQEALARLSTVLELYRQL